MTNESDVFTVGDKIRLAELKELCHTPTGKTKKTANKDELNELAILLGKEDSCVEMPEEENTPLMKIDLQADPFATLASATEIPTEAQPFVAKGYMYLGANEKGFVFVADRDIVYRIRNSSGAGVEDHLYAICARKDFTQLQLDALKR